MNNIKKHVPLMEYLKTLSEKEQRLFLKSASRPLLRAFAEIALNIVKRQLPLSNTDIKRLKKHENEIIQLSKRKHSHEKRKQILMKGGFLPSLLSLLPTLVTGILTSLQ